MDSTFTDTIAWVRRSEYTGENRCMPCTIANLSISVVISGALSIVSPLLGIVVFAASIVLITLRGYLVPGTPKLTKRYFPDWVLRWFENESHDHAPINVSTSEGDSLDVETTLLRLGVIKECGDRSDLCLDASFRSVWHDRFDVVRDDETRHATLAALLDVEETDISVNMYGNAFVAKVDGQQAGRWESRAAFFADIAAADALAQHSSEWTNLGVAERGGLLRGLRMFLNICPVCGGSVSLAEETMKSCCRLIPVATVTCDDCGAQLFETRYESGSSDI